MFKKKLPLLSAAILTATYALAPNSFAASQNTISAPSWMQSISGQTRVYEFDRIHNHNETSVPANISAFATSAMLFGQTKSFYGFSAGLGVYVASNLGIGPLNNSPSRDTSLMGTSNTYSTPGQAFIQYQNKFLKARAGNQLIDTPWVNPSDSRIIPASYQGYTAEITPIHGLGLDVGYIRSWQQRGDASFGSPNLYGYQTSGFSYAGIKYPFVFGANALKLQGWYYHFNDIANLSYLQANYSYHLGSVDPLAAFQYASESDTGAKYMGNISARVIGAELGAKVGSGTYTIAYDNIPSNSSSYNDGNIVSPYTYSYATDPLFTTSMNEGMIGQKTSGHGWKAKAVYWVGQQKNWRFIGSFSHYSQPQMLHVNQEGNPSEVDLDATYFFRQGKFKGMSLRGRFGDFTYKGAPAQFMYARVQMQYDF